jgi:hypothetical protein
MVIKNYIKFIKENNENSLKTYAYSLLSNNINYQGFNNVDDAMEELDYFFEVEYPNLNGNVALYRILNSESKEDIDLVNIGEHFTQHKERTEDHNFWEMIGINIDDNIYRLEIEIDSVYIDFYEVIKCRLSYNTEFEITLNTKNPKYKLIDITKLN